MSKYHQLIKEYSETIAGIKADKKRQAQLRRKLDLAMEADDYDEIENLADEVAYLQDEIAFCMSELDRLVQEEYASVPYNKPRQAGIAGFWRESGLKK